MATKTISLRVEAYERLRRARRHPSESFSEVVMRAEWPDLGISGRGLLEIYRREGPFLSAAALERVAEGRALDAPPEDKWQRD
jgi:predicted CopG family antitoxin